MRFEFELVESATWFSAWRRWINKHHMFGGIWEKDQDYVRTDYGRWKDKVPIQKFWCESSREVEMRMYFRTSVCADTCARLLTHASRFATTTRCSCSLGIVSPRFLQMIIIFLIFLKFLALQIQVGASSPNGFSASERKCISHGLALEQTRHWTPILLVSWKTIGTLLLAAISNANFECAAH